MIHVPNYSSLGWFLFLSTVLSCFQLLTADDSCYDRKKSDWNLYVDTRVDMYANFVCEEISNLICNKCFKCKFQLSRSMFIFISFITVDSFHEKKNQMGFSSIHYM